MHNVPGIFVFFKIFLSLFVSLYIYTTEKHYSNFDSIKRFVSAFFSLVSNLILKMKNGGVIRSLIYKKGNPHWKVPDQLR